MAPGPPSGEFNQQRKTAARRAHLFYFYLHITYVGSSCFKRYFVIVSCTVVLCAVFCLCSVFTLIIVSIMCMDYGIVII